MKSIHNMEKFSEINQEKNEMLTQDYQYKDILIDPKWWCEL